MRVITVNVVIGLTSRKGSVHTGLGRIIPAVSRYRHAEPMNTVKSSALCDRSREWECPNFEETRINDSRTHLLAFYARHRPVMFPFTKRVEKITQEHLDEGHDGIQSL